MGRVTQPPADQPGEWERKARRLAETQVKPHFAPSPEILAIFRRRLQARQANHDPATALVLGATPELVDAAVANGLRPIVVDRSATMLDAALARCSLTTRPGEARIVADWRSMNSIADASIDVVLGDAALNNVAHEATNDVLRELARVTRPGGFLLLRQIVLPDTGIEAYEWKNALERLRSGQIDLDAFDRVLRFYSFNSLALDTTRHAIDARHVFACIREKFDAGELRSDEFDFLLGRYSEVCHTVYGASEQALQLGRLGRCEVERLPESVFYRDLMAVFVVEVGRP